MQIRIVYARMALFPLWGIRHHGTE